MSIIYQDVRLDNRSGRPIAGAVVQLLDNTTLVPVTISAVSGWPVVNNAVTTDENGRFKFRAPSGATYAVSTVYNGLENILTDIQIYDNELAPASGAGEIGYSAVATYPAATVGRKLQQVISVTDAPYNADPTGVADATAAIQAAIDAVGSNGAILFPLGTYKITSTLTYTGNSGEALTLYSNVRPSRGLAGACLFWAGAVGGTILQVTGANNLYLNSLVFDGNDLALRCVYALPPASSGIAAQDCIFADCMGVNSALVQLGNSNLQVSEVSFLRCEFQGAPVYGLLTATANVKNFSVDTCKFNGMQRGISWGSAILGNSSGSLVVKFGTFNTTVSDIYVAGGGGSLTVIGIEAEGSARFIEGPGTVAGPNAITCIGVQWEAGIPPADDFVIHNVSAKLNLIGCQFENVRVPGVSLPKINVTNTYFGTPASSINSFGNYYSNCTTRAPFYTAGNWVLDPEAAPLNQYNAEVTSFGDAGGTNTSPIRLQACVGQIANASVGVSTYQQVAGLANVYGGRLTRSLFKVTIPNSVWTAAATSQSIVFGTLVGKSKIVGIYADTTQAYAGLAGTIALKFDNASGGSGLLLSADVKTAPVTQGLLAADLGAKLDAAGAVQGGYVAWSGQTSLYATLTSGSGNLGNGTVTNLTTGSTTVYVETENFL